MTDSKTHGGKREGAGRPSGSEYPEKVFARITREQRALIDAHYTSDSDAIRAALDCLEKHPPKK